MMDESDPEMRAMAREELSSGERRMEELEQDIQLLLLPRCKDQGVTPELEKITSSACTCVHTASRPARTRPNRLNRGLPFELNKPEFFICSTSFNSNRIAWTLGSTLLRLKIRACRISGLHYPLRFFYLVLSGKTVAF